jgi:hypothetical protein
MPGGLVQWLLLAGILGGFLGGSALIIKSVRHSNAGQSDVHALARAPRFVQICAALWSLAWSAGIAYNARVYPEGYGEPLVVIAFLIAPFLLALLPVAATSRRSFMRVSGAAAVLLSLYVFWTSMTIGRVYAPAVILTVVAGALAARRRLPGYPEQDSLS